MISSRLHLHPSVHRVNLLTAVRAVHVKYPPPPSHYDTTPQQNIHSRSYTLRICASLFILGALISYNYPLYTIGEKLHPLPSTDSDLNHYTAHLESTLSAIPLVANLSKDKNYTLSRGWNHLDLTGAGLPTFHGTLRTPGGIAIPPIAFHNTSSSHDLAIVHLGRRLSGFPFIVHGGITGMVTEETFKAAIQRHYPHLHYNDIHTKSLSLNYKSPVFVNQFVILDSSITQIDDNSYSLNGEMKSLDGKVLLKATATLSTESFNNTHKSSSYWPW